MSLSQAIRDIIDENLKKVEIGFIGQIVTFDKDKMRAEISPLLEFTTEINGADNPETIQAPNIKDVPVELIFAGGFYIRPVYKKGDLVKCTLSASGTSRPLTQDSRGPRRADTGDNRFSLSYVTVSGGVTPKDNFTPPAEWSREGMVIGNENGFIEMAENGDVIINSEDDNAVRFSKLKETIDELQNDITNLKSIFSAWVPVPTDGGAALKTALAPYFAAPLVKPIDPAKIENVKLP